MNSGLDDASVPLLLAPAAQAVPVPAGADIEVRSSDRRPPLASLDDGAYGPGERHAPMVYAGDPRRDVPSALRKHLAQTLRDRDVTIVKGWLDGIARGGAEDLGLE